MKNISIQLKADLNLLHQEKSSERILEALITSPAKTKQRDRKALNISIVLDKSGSMHGDKIDNVKRAAAQILSVLNEDDRFSIVAFDTGIYEISRSMLASEANKKSALTMVRSLSAGTSTNLSEGWLRGAQQVADHKSENTLNRVLLLTDGLANRGIVSVEELAEHASELHSRGVSTSTFGVGLDYAEGFLAPMATSGGGNYYYIARPDQIPGIFSEELDELTSITASETEVEISIPDYVSVELQGRWRSNKSKKKLTVFLGDIPANVEQALYFKVVTPPFNKRKTFSISAKVSAKDEDGKPLEGDSSKITFKYETPAVIERAVADPILERKAAAVFVAAAAVEAHRMERKRDYKKAKKILDLALLEYGSRLEPSELDRYQRLARRIQHGLDPVMSKMSHMNSYVGSRGSLRRIDRERKRK